MHNSNCNIKITVPRWGSSAISHHSSFGTLIIVKGKQFTGLHVHAHTHAQTLKKTQKLKGTINMLKLHRIQM